MAEPSGGLGVDREGGKGAATGNDAADEALRVVVSRQWATDWDSPEDAVYDDKLRNAIEDALDGLSGPDFYVPGNAIPYLIAAIWPLVNAEKESWDKLARDANRAAIKYANERDAALAEVARLKSVVVGESVRSSLEQDAPNENEPETFEYALRWSDHGGYVISAGRWDSAEEANSARYPGSNAVTVRRRRGDWEVAP